jgi:GntR family transcriptional regulator of vanillate catabolism
MAELRLVERLGVSRTPLREALATLAHEGLLETAPGGGYVVRTFTRADIADAIELRGVLEGTAARMAAERRRQDTDALEALNEQTESVLGRRDFAAFERYMDLNAAFHAEVLRLAGSPMLERSLEQVLALPFASPNAFVRAESELPESRNILAIGLHHHRELVRAISSGEGTRAEALGREHARLALRNLELVLRRGHGLDGVPGGSLFRSDR